jgi:diguanylate cyclase (GGDEF)-like protein
MSASRRDILLGIGLVAFLALAVWAAAALTSGTISKLLALDAETEASSWSRYLAANVADLPSIVKGAAPSPESRDFFERAQKVGDVFLYKIYDPDGQLRLSSDALQKIGSQSESIEVHNPAVAQAVLSGRAVVEVRGGEDEEDEEEEGGAEPIGIARPAFYSEAYVPVVVAGRTIGIVETYVDQSVKHTAFRSRVAGALLTLAAIIACAYAVPAVGFYLRTRQKRQADSRAEFLAKHDALTGLFNRVRFMRDLDQALSPKCPVVVHCIDIDRFREMNDAYGHTCGDEILKQVARRLQTLSGKSDLLARLDGDEFALAQVISDEQEIDAFSRRLSLALSEPYHLRDQDIEATASVGTAVAPGHGDSAETLIKNAEMALSHSQSEGLGGRSIFRPEMDAELRTQRELESQLKRAVAEGGFELHFQPIHRAADTRLVGFEALLRLPAGPNGHVSPAVFVPLLERLGLIAAAGEWVLRRACTVAATWPAHLMISVNLSPAQFTAGDIASVTKDELARSGLAAERLELEITEGLLLSQSPATMAQLEGLKALGVRVAMDDFGTGYSSLNYLWRFPFDKLKIDQSFVRGLDSRDEHLPSVIRAIIALGRSLGMIITAEGVETAAQAEFLQQAGCDLLQGFYLGRPQPVENLPGLILRDALSSGGPEPRLARSA